VVCDVESRTVGYALLISFWSNELGGEVCNIDELFVAPLYRGRGLATALLEELADKEQSVWRIRPAALALEVLISYPNGLAHGPGKIARG
jgi:GNAT superfamily N-acetyltransferase